MKWLRRAEWQDAFNELLNRHLAPVCAKFDVAVDELPELIEDQHLAVWGCIFEDFLARNLDDGRNIVDDYLKRRGWKESASNKAYMAALRSSGCEPLPGRPRPHPRWRTSGLPYRPARSRQRGRMPFRTPSPRVCKVRHPWQLFQSNLG